MQILTVLCWMAVALKSVITFSLDQELESIPLIMQWMHGSGHMEPAMRSRSESGIMSGLEPVCIGDNTIIGSGSVITKDIPTNVVAAGVPCKVIREITEADKTGYRP